MGFYGNVSNAQNVTFTFDRIYPNFALMSENCAVDGVYPGRFVLVEYDTALTIGTRGFLRVFRGNDGQYYIDPLRTPETLLYYGGTDSSNTITHGRLAYYTENDDYDGLTGEPGLVTFLICSNTQSDLSGSVPAEFVEIVTSDNRPYTINFNVDKNYLMYHKGASAKDIGRGYDSTVWEKMYINGKEQYVQIAELNSVVPTFDIGMDAPTSSPIIPHWDTNSTTVYYKVHWQPQWGMRQKAASTMAGPKFTDDGVPVANQIDVWGDNNADYSIDKTNYPSDQTTTWVRREYNKTTDRYTYYYYAKETVTDEETGETEDRWNWYTQEQLNGNADLDQNIPAAIYFNAAGFDSAVSHYSSDEPTAKLEANGWDGKDRITMDASGISGHLYGKHDGSINKDVAEDIQELSVMLPSVGDTIAKVWDIVYGDRELNGYTKDTTTGEWVLPEGETSFKRNQDIQWDSTQGLRAVTLNPDSLGYKYNTAPINTLAGVINSTHDLMGMILVESDAPMNGEETIRNADFGKIYYFTRDEKFCRKHKTYTYSGQTVDDYIWRPVELTADSWEQNVYYYIDANGSLNVTAEDGSAVKLSADRSSEFDSNKQYYAKYIKEFSYTALDHDLIDYEPGRYYYKDPFGNYTLATEPSFFVDKNYYSFTNPPEGPLEFSASYEPNRYWYKLNNNFYLDTNEIIDGSRNYVTFTPQQITKYIYGANLYYYSTETGMHADPEGTPTDEREYFVRTLEKMEGTEDQYREVFTSIGAWGSEGCTLVQYTPNMYYQRLSRQETSSEQTSVGDEPVQTTEIPYEYRLLTAPTFEGGTSTLNYYVIEPEEVRPAFLYVPNVYYYKDENTYYLAYSSVLSDTAEYYRINPQDIVKAEGFYKANTYYINDNGTYRLDSSLTKDHPYNEYYLRDTYYVFNDDLNYYSQGAVWNDIMNLIPNTITLGTRTEAYDMVELPEFARGMNTLHGAILKMAQLMEVGDAQTRDKSTMQGCINSMNDILNKFGEFSPRQFLIVDNYGRLTSTEWTTEQPYVATNHGFLTNNTTTLAPAEDRWIHLSMDDNAASPLLTIRHEFTSVPDTTSTANKNAAAGTGLNKGITDDLKLYTPIVDSTGHVVGKNVETVTLPYGFKSFTVTNSSTDTSYTDGTTNNVIANTTQDILNFAAGNKWIRFATTPLDDKITIAHETHSIDTEAVDGTDFNADGAVSFFTVQDLTFDTAGHVVSNKNHSYTLPYTFKTIELENVTTDTAWSQSGESTTSIVADGITDTFKFKGGNKWIRFTSHVNSDELLIAHETHEIDIAAATETNLNSDSTGTLIIPDWSYDVAGHITAKKSHSYTLPYNFKTITPGNTNSWAVSATTNTTSAVADSVYDTLTIQGDNNWIKIRGNNSNNDQIIIGHGAPDTTAANLTANTGASDSNIITNAFGSAITIPTFKYDAAGHISSTSSFTVNIPGLTLLDAASDTTSTAEILSGFSYTAPAQGNNYTGQLQAKKRNVTSLLMTGYEAPPQAGAQTIAATDTVGQAFNKLQASVDAVEASIGTLNGANTVTGSVAKSIKDAIDALDSTSSTDTDTSTHVFVTSVTQTDGKVTVKTRALAKADIPALDYISSTAKPTDVVKSGTGSSTTNYSNQTYIDIIKDLAARIAALEAAANS